MVSLVSLAGQDQLGPYRLLNIIKTGQSSQVWAAIRDSDQQRVAIKALLSDFRKDREHIGYLKHEFEVGKALDHNHVIHVYDFAMHRSSPYLAMEFFPYPNMKDVILQVRDEVAFMMPQIIARAAAGLAYFNDQGWVHRDVKPDNFLVNREADVKLIDFALAQRKLSGLAKLFGGRTKKIQGTRSYMSPEQIRGEPLDLRSDVYSFGCTIFHLVAGLPPFTGTSSNDLLNKHLRAPVPSPEAANRNLTSEFGDLLRSTMAKKPELRPESMHQFLARFQALEMFKQLPPPTAPVDSAEKAV